MRKTATRVANTKAQQGGRYVQVPEGIKLLMIDKAGTLRFDILPYRVTVKNHPKQIEVGGLWYQRNFSIHRNVGVDKNSYVCPRSVQKGNCPICEAYADAVKNQDEETAKALKPSDRTLFNVIDTKNKDGSICILNYSYYLFEKLLNSEIRELEEDADIDPDWFFADLVGGSTLKVRFTEKSLGKRNFYDAEKIDFVSRDDYGESILEKTVDLDKALTVLSYDDLSRIFLDLSKEPEGDTDVEKDAEENTNEAPKKKKKKKRECPFGYTFALDYGNYVECQTCKLSKKCFKSA